MTTKVGFLELRRTVTTLLRMHRHPIGILIIMSLGDFSFQIRIKLVTMSNYTERKI